MPLIYAKCPNCGANLKVDSDKDTAVCEYCGGTFIIENLEKVDDEKDLVNVEVDTDRQKAIGRRALAISLISLFVLIFLLTVVSRIGHSNSEKESTSSSYSSTTTTESQEDKDDKGHINIDINMSINGGNKK